MAPQNSDQLVASAMYIRQLSSTEVANSDTSQGKVATTATPAASASQGLLEWRSFISC